jgi:hypothetical protein
VVAAAGDTVPAGALDCVALAGAPTCLAAGLPVAGAA